MDVYKCCHCLRKAQIETKCVTVYEKRKSKRNAPLFTKSAIRNERRHCLRKTPFETKMRHCLRKTPFETKSAIVYEKRKSKRKAPLFTKSANRNEKRHCLRKKPFETKTAPVYERRNSKPKPQFETIPPQKKIKNTPLPLSKCHPAAVTFRCPVLPEDFFRDWAKPNP